MKKRKEIFQCAHSLSVSLSLSPPLSFCFSLSCFLSLPLGIFLLEWDLKLFKILSKSRDARLQKRNEMIAQMAECGTENTSGNREGRSLALLQELERAKARKSNICVWIWVQIQKSSLSYGFNCYFHDKY